MIELTGNCCWPGGSELTVTRLSVSGGFCLDTPAPATSPASLSTSWKNKSRNLSLAIFRYLHNIYEGIKNDRFEIL